MNVCKLQQKNSTRIITYNITALIIIGNDISLYYLNHFHRSIDSKNRTNFQEYKGRF